MADDKTNEDTYLAENPGAELALFMSWFHTCCNWEQVVPTQAETDTARAQWTPGKAPADAAREMIRARTIQPAVRKMENHEAENHNPAGYDPSQSAGETRR